MSDEIKKLLETQNTAFEAFKTAVAAEAKAKTAENTAVVEKLNAELNRVGKELNDLAAKATALEALAARPNRGDGTKATPEQIAHKAGLFDYIRKGNESGLRDLELKALSAGVAGDGGFTVHAELDAAIDRVARVNVNMRRLATVRPITKGSYKKMVTTSGAGIGGWGYEHTAPSESTTPGLVELEFVPGNLWAEPRATQDLLDDSDQNIESWLADEVGIIFESTENQGFIDGNGVNRPRGFLDYSKVANASYAWGSLGYVPSGHASTFRTTTTAVSPVDDFIALRHALKPVYRGNAVWLMNDATVATVRKFKDAQGNLQWKPGASVAEGFQETFLGHQIAYDDQMPDVAADAYAVAFGDFKRGYLIVDRMGTMVVRDALTSKPYVKFYTRRRVGGGVQNFEAIKLMKIATS